MRRNWAPPEPPDRCSTCPSLVAQKQLQGTGTRPKVFATGTGHGGGSIQFVEVRHRVHARVEDRIRTGKATGCGRFPSRQFAINAAWLELALTGIDLLAWTQHPAPGRAVAVAEPKKLRYGLLHVAAKLTGTARTTTPRASPNAGPGPTS